jgi:hypothetical protein
LTRPILATLVAFGLALSATPADAAGNAKPKTKPLKPCTLIQSAEPERAGLVAELTEKLKRAPTAAELAARSLQNVFGQPFRNGITTGASECEYHRPDGSHIPDIVVSLVAERFKTVKKAKQAFRHSSDILAELAGGVKKVDGIGDEAFSTYFIGSDEMTVRVGKMVTDLRVDRNDTDARYPREIVLVATLLATGMTDAQP